MKKILSAIFIASLLLSACSAQTSTPGPSPMPAVTEYAPEPKNTPEAVSRLGVKEDALRGLEITVWIPWFGIEADLFSTMVKDFNAMNEWGIKVNAESQVNFNVLYENVTASLPTQNHPDVAIALPEHALIWDADGALAELTPYVEDPIYGMDGADFVPVFWNQDEIGGRRVAVPAQRTARVLLWNETWAGELGFDAPPNSPQDFKQQACRAHQSMLSDGSPNNDGRGGWILEPDSMTAYAWLLAFDGGILEGNNYRFLTPNNIKAFEFLKGLTETACAWQTTNSDPIPDFATRQAMFITAGLEDFPAIARAFAAADNTDKWSALAFPGDTLVVYGSSYMMLKSTPEKQLAAWIFIRWMLDAKQDARWVETTHLFPLRASTSSLLAAYRDSHPQWADAVKLLPHGVLQPQLASWKTVKIMLGDGFADMFRRADLPSGQVIPNTLQQMQDIAQDLNQ